MDQSQRDGSLWGDFKIWFNQPFAVEQDALHWFYFFGLIIFISIAWQFVLRHIFEGVKTAREAV